VSRTVLAERFNTVLGQAPIGYVMGWRMQLAAERMRNSDHSLAAIAADVGYESEAAFNRAFKRVTGTGTDCTGIPKVVSARVGFHCLPARRIAKKQGHACPNCMP